jgi:hypothetical protein
MESEKIMELYMKEREYQQKIFGDYKHNPNLNIASFMNFIEEYISKAKKSYSDPWTSAVEAPDWLDNCSEFKTQQLAPVKSYEYLIKVMALAGAALEAYTEIAPEYWREDGKPKDKWNI